ncbi:hypothetical protein PORY_001091 [Pneumocystis oryctolagi]|uniref:Uncharacterized protein n=1 Tax=Pneumocystis oryctolagi TaxID=42067 RepID=A0ACB7CDS6_9ASCO|nr:hypothetical protein PORY_001091 [Pneumocystis oryctolagi]
MLSEMTKVFPFFMQLRAKNSRLISLINVYKWNNKSSDVFFLRFRRFYVFRTNNMNMSTGDVKKVLDKMQSAFSWDEKTMRHLLRARDLVDRKIPVRISIFPAESCLSGRIPIVDILLFDPFNVDKKVISILENGYALFFTTNLLKRIIIRHSLEAKVIKNDNDLVIEIPHYFLEKNNIEFVEHKDPIAHSSIFYDRSIIYCKKITGNLLSFRKSIFIIETKSSAFSLFYENFDNIIPVSSLGVKNAIKNLMSSTLNVLDYEKLLVESNYSSLKDIVSRFNPYEFVSNLVFEAEKNIKDLEFENFKMHSLKLTQDVLMERVDTWVEDAGKELLCNVSDMTNCWAKLEFWKLFWRVDDVLNIVRDTIQDTFLVDSEINMYFFIGQFSDKCVTFKSPINMVRKKIIGHPLYVLSRISQTELLKSIFMISTSCFLTYYLYIICNFSLYSSISVMFLGITFSLVVLQSSWSRAKRNFEIKMEKEGRLGLQMIEENLRSIIKNEKFYILKEKRRIIEAKKILEEINLSTKFLN